MITVQLPLWFTNGEICLATTDGKLTAACSAEAVVYVECIDEDYQGYFSMKDLVVVK